MTGTIDGAPIFLALALGAGIYTIIVLAVVTALWFASRPREGKEPVPFYSLDCLSGIHKACPHCHCTHHLAVDA